MSVSHRPRWHCWELVEMLRSTTWKGLWVIWCTFCREQWDLHLLPHSKGGSFLHRMFLPWHDVSHRLKAVMGSNLSNRTESLLFISHLAGVPCYSDGDFRSLCLSVVYLQHLLHTQSSSSSQGMAMHKIKPWVSATHTAMEEHTE